MNQDVNVPAQNRKGYAQRTPDDYIGLMNPDVRAELNITQLDEVRRLIAEAIPKPSPKIVDLRFTIDLLISRFYVVLFVGKDRRRKPRKSSILDPLTYTGNLIAVIVLLIGFNLMASAALILVLYLLKSALNINLMQGHFPDLLRRLLR